MGRLSASLPILWNSMRAVEKFGNTPLCETPRSSPASLAEIVVDLHLFYGYIISDFSHEPFWDILQIYSIALKPISLRSFGTVR
jgi:hypothetical protein